ncbi:unnamed protein product [Diatraea saccharalis]|uniref:Lipase domain-containing protein n=1 Tax=Diatraea saccharalis TaxID=40085 RepID=A0A9P0CAP5_9NEOP|nr:unnamed protein product [Diatraea saccharalis]
MKLLVVVAAFIALCAGSAIPLIPGDNSHYVEGESRYIWIPDGDDVPQLVDLQEPADQALLMSRNGANNQYWLFTRQNPTSRQELVNGNINSIRNSNYRGNRPTKVIVHGWNSNGYSNINPMIRDAFLAVEDCNVIVVDWRALANSNYASAVIGVPSVGQFLGNFLVWLFNNAGGNWNQLHLVGFSLGAHIVGNAIHTDGGLLGIFDRVANADFYPNGGRNPQPGCFISTCSHSRAYQLFAASIRYNRMGARQCSNKQQVQNNQCSGSALNMGNHILSKRG